MTFVSRYDLNVNRHVLIKFDAVKLSHLVDAEYGNQGVDFKMVPREGFGWMNCTYFLTLLWPFRY